MIRFDIPFAVTEYAEQSADQTADNLNKMRQTAAEAMPPGAEEYAARLARPRSHPVTVNPFHRPGQRPIGSIRTPNVYGGFVVSIITTE